MNHYVSLSLTNRKYSVHLHALNSPGSAVRTFAPPQGSTRDVDSSSPGISLSLGSGDSTHHTAESLSTLRRVVRVESSAFQAQGLTHVQSGLLLPLVTDFLSSLVLLPLSQW
jgi:hypothetical protein